MATVQEGILNEFYAKLAQSGSVDQTTIDSLRALLTSGKKLKSEDLTAILAKEPVGGRP